jgi:hypothetical protein
MCKSLEPWHLGLKNGVWQRGKGCGGKSLGKWRGLDHTPNGWCESSMFPKGKLLLSFALVIFVVLGAGPGPRTCQASTVPLSHTPVPTGRI